MPKSVSIYAFKSLTLQLISILLVTTGLLRDKQTYARFSNQTKCYIIGHATYVII